MLPTLPTKAKGFTSHHGNSLVQRGAGAVMCRHHLSPLVNKAKGGGGLRWEGERYLTLMIGKQSINNSYFKLNVNKNAGGIELSFS